MTRTFLFVFLILASTTHLSLEPALAGDLAAGKAKAQSLCQTCHGLDGMATTAMVPNLSGQQKEYLVSKLEDFVSGRRRHEQMSIIANLLTDDDIENVAEWYSSIKISVEMPF